MSYSKSCIFLVSDSAVCRCPVTWRHGFQTVTKPANHYAVNPTGLGSRSEVLCWYRQHIVFHILAHILKCVRVWVKKSDNVTLSLQASRREITVRESDVEAEEVYLISTLPILCDTCCNDADQTTSSFGRYQRFHISAPGLVREFNVFTLHIVALYLLRTYQRNLFRTHCKSLVGNIHVSLYILFFPEFKL